MAKIKFDRTDVPIGSVEFSRNPKTKGGYSREFKMKQPTRRVAGGDFYSNNKGVEDEFITLFWENIPTADWVNYISFMENIAKGNSNSFNFTDYDGTVYSNSFIWNAESTPSAPVAHERESLTVVIKRGPVV